MLFCGDFFKVRPKPVSIPTRRPLLGGLAILMSIAPLSACTTSGKTDVDSVLSQAADADAAETGNVDVTKNAENATRLQTPNLAGTDSAADTLQTASVPAAAPDRAPSFQEAVMQPTAINASAMSIFANARPGAQPVQAASYAPETGTRSFFAQVYSMPEHAYASSPGLYQSLQIESPKETHPELSTRLAVDEDSEEDDKPRGLARLVSLSGMTRIAANGLAIQTPDIDVSCFKPELMGMIHDIENHFGKKVLVTSGYRDKERNRRVGGVEGSLHTHCDAADIQVKGVSNWDLATYARALPNRGGVGTYCHTKSIHIDTGRPRDWNWTCDVASRK